MTQKMMPTLRARQGVRWGLWLPGLMLMMLLGTAQADTEPSGAEPADVNAGPVETDDTTAASTRKQRRASREALDARLDSLLAEALPADEYRQSRSCLSRNTYRRIEVLNEEYVLFSKGEEYWINKLRRRCPSLRFNDLPVFVAKGANSLCESDPFYPTNSMDLNMSLSGGRAMGAQGICYLGDFEQISAAQAALIRGG